MSEVSLGKLCGEDAQRDACHVAVIPVVAAESMRPGEHIGLCAGVLGSVWIPTVRSDCIGIVDPFLDRSVRKGDRFLMWLYPGTVTGMRHHWSHPSFLEFVPSAVITNRAETPDDKEESIQWLKDFAEDIGLSYGTLIHALEANVECGEYHIFRDEDTPGRCYSDAKEMWEHYERITGVKLKPGQSDELPFSCAC